MYIEISAYIYVYSMNAFTTKRSLNQGDKYWPGYYYPVHHCTSAWAVLLLVCCQFVRVSSVRSCVVGSLVCRQFVRVSSVRSFVVSSFVCRQFVRLSSVRSFVISSFMCRPFISSFIYPFVRSNQPHSLYTLSLYCFDQYTYIWVLFLFQLTRKCAS
mgnify:CR=1 FL=1